MGAGARIRLVLPGQVRYLDLVHGAAQEMGRAAGLDNDEALDFALAVREAAVNAIEHGGGGEAGESIELVLEEARNAVRARIRDRGEGFDPEEAIRRAEELGPARTSGRGILMMSALTDEMRCRPRRGGGFEVVLVKRVRIDSRGRAAGARKPARS